MSVARADDIDDLKATNEAEVNALHARDVGAYLATLHPEEVSYFATEAFPVDYRVIESTGLVWGHVKVESKPKDGPMQIRYYRGLWVYVKSGGKWLRVARHVSSIPQGN